MTVFNILSCSLRHKKQKKILKTINCHNILRLCDILPIFFFSPQVKRSVVISNENGISQLHLAEQLKTWYFRKSENRKTSKLQRKNSAQSSPHNKNFVNDSKKLLKNKSWTFPAERYFKQNQNFVSSILSMIVVMVVFNVSIFFWAEIVLRFL